MRVTWWAGICGAILTLVAMVSAIQVFALPQTETEISKEETQAVQSRLSAIHSADAARIASALGVEAASKEPTPEFTHNYLQDLGDLDDDGVSEYALEWLGRSSLAPGPGAPEDSPNSWALFLLAWNGARWQVSPLIGGTGFFTLQVLPAIKSGERSIAVVVLAGATEIPYPVLFRFQAHLATSLWDSRSDESRYEGYDDGHVQFLLASGALQMVATGRADPGFLVFPKKSGRGFEARTVYNWDGKAFIPIKTEYSANRDFALYRFIAALHLHDFRTAYSLTDPPKFLKSDKPALPAFRKLIEDAFPEFLGDQIFRAQDSAGDDYTFKLEGSDKVYVYTPEFTGGPRFLLSGLERKERKPGDE